MNKLHIALTAAIVMFTAQVVAAEDAPQLESNLQKASYGIGFNAGAGMQQEGFSVDIAAFVAGMQDALAQKEPQLKQEVLQAAFAALQQELQKKQVAEAAVATEKNKAEGAAFLAANAKKPDVQTLPNGLQYKIIREGTGAKPTATSVIKAHYTGRLLDGRVFDSSMKRKQPIEIPVNEVIKGWTDALQLMKVGGKWELYIPSDLAYGPTGPGRGIIGPNATLIFEIELLDIVK